MIATVIAVVLLIIGLLAIGGGRATRNSTQDSDRRAAGAGGIGAGGLFILLGIGVLGFNMVHVIQPNEVGVPITIGKAGDALQSGLRITAPWTNIETLPTRPQTITTVANVRTSDSGHAGIRISARWATSRENARELYLQVRTGDDEKIQNDIVIPQVQGAANQFYGTVNNTNAISGAQWTTNATGVLGLATTRLAKYGITLQDVQIREVEPDAATNAALNQVAAQIRQTQIANESKNTADAQAKQRLAEALGIKNAADQVKDLTPTQVQILCLQAAERVANENAAKGIPTYTTPCGSGATGVIAK